MNAELIALAALIPMMAGTSPAVASERSMVAQLCSGGTISIPLGNKGDDRENAPCKLQACHAAPCRKKFDPSQGRRAAPLP